MNLRDKPDENKIMEGEEEEEIMYGAPDEKVWTDKSHSQIESEKHGAIVDNELVSMTLVSALRSPLYFFFNPNFLL
jgi:hypothetical protein